MSAKSTNSTMRDNRRGDAGELRPVMSARCIPSNDSGRGIRRPGRKARSCTFKKAAKLSHNGIVCPECKGKLSSVYKRRKGEFVRRCYRCPNARCSARSRNEEVRIYTNEAVWLKRRKVLNSSPRNRSPEIGTGERSKIDSAASRTPGDSSTVRNLRKLNAAD